MEKMGFNQTRFGTLSKASMNSLGSESPRRALISNLLRGKSGLFNHALLRCPVGFRGEENNRHPFLVGRGLLESDPFPKTSQEKTCQRKPLVATGLMRGWVNSRRDNSDARHHLDHKRQTKRTPDKIYTHARKLTFDGNQKGDVHTPQRKCTRSSSLEVRIRVPSFL